MHVGARGDACVVSCRRRDTSAQWRGWSLARRTAAADDCRRLRLQHAQYHGAPQELGDRLLPLVFSDDERGSAVLSQRSRQS
jgi:hypothetical protein